MMKLTSFDNNDSPPTMFSVENARSPWRIIVSIVCALAIVTTLFYAFLYLRNRHAAQFPLSGQQQPVAKSKVVPQAQIAQDETWVKSGQAIIGGTVRNISHENLPDLTLEIELKRRTDGQTENRTVELTPKSLQPTQEAKFSVRVPSRDYVGVRLVRLKSAANSAEIAFTTVNGIPRPFEHSPQAKTIVVQRNAPRHTGEEFLNTPDNPETIR